MRTQKIRHDEETRLKIKASQLLNRLQGHAFNELQMSATQIKAAEICLRKVLPDLASVEHSGEVTHNFIEAPTVLTEEQWLQKRAIVSGPADPDRRLN